MNKVEQEISFILFCGILNMIKQAIADNEISKVAFLQDLVDYYREYYLTSANWLQDELDKLIAIME